MPKEKDDRPVILSTLGIDHKTLSRWRGRLKDEKKFEAAGIGPAVSNDQSARDGDVGAFSIASRQPHR